MRFLNLSSTDSLVFYPDNTAYDFTVELPDYFEGQYQCALMDFSCAASLSEELYIFSDICEPEYVHDCILPLLRIVRERGEVNTPFFKVASRRVIQRVRIFIRNHRHETPTQEIGPVRVTLALRKYLS